MYSKNQKSITSINHRLYFLHENMTLYFIAIFEYLMYSSPRVMILRSNEDVTIEIERGSLKRANRPKTS